MFSISLPHVRAVDDSQIDTNVKDLEWSPPIGMIIDSSNQRPYSWIIWNQKNLLINKINTVEIDRELVLNTHD